MPLRHVAGCRITASAWRGARDFSIAAWRQMLRHGAAPRLAAKTTYASVAFSLFSASISINTAMLLSRKMSEEEQKDDGGALYSPAAT